MRQGHLEDALWQIDHAIELAVDIYAAGESEQAVRDLMSDKLEIVRSKEKHTDEMLAKAEGRKLLFEKMDDNKQTNGKPYSNEFFMDN